MPTRIVIGGPPNSGKSTLAENLARTLRSLGVDAYAEDLDLASPTLEFIQGHRGWEERPGVKRKLTPELAIEAAALFEQASAKHAVVIGDAPGKITSESETIAKKAHYAIILCRADSLNEVNNWRQFFANLDIQVVCVAISKMIGIGDIKESGGTIEATLVGLNRRVKDDPIIRALAVMMKEALDL